MDTENTEDRLEARANALYWDSDASVNQIADELEVSKGALYGMVRPLGAGLSCPDCRSEMEYPNRTARDRGQLTCPACGLEEEEDDVRDLWQHAPAGGGGEAGEAAAQAVHAGEVGRAGSERGGSETPTARGGSETAANAPWAERARESARRLPPERLALGAALLAAAAGFVVGRLTRRG